MRIVLNDLKCWSDDRTSEPLSSCSFTRFLSFLGSWLTHAYDNRAYYIHAKILQSDNPISLRSWASRINRLLAEEGLAAGAGEEGTTWTM
jgi:hypothetical protein